MAADYPGLGAVTLPGTNQIIPSGTKPFVPTTAHSNKVQAGQLPRTQSAKIGRPDKANPLGRGSSESLVG